MTSQCSFKCEYAKSNRSKCRTCKLNIDKSELRIGETIQANRFDRKIALWHHATCYCKDAEWPVESAESLDGFADLRFEDQEHLKVLHGGGAPGNEDEKDTSLVESTDADAFNISIEEKQSNEFFELHDLLKENTKRKHWLEILEANKQRIRKGTSNPDKLLYVTDVILYGAPMPCPKCNSRSFAYKNTAYKCHSCNEIIVPKRERAIIPETLRNEHTFLQRDFGTRTQSMDEDIVAKMERMSIQPSAEKRSAHHASCDSGINFLASKSKRADESHVYRDGNLTYSQYLTNVNIADGKNSYYKIELLESNEQMSRKYWVVKEYGRTGTAIGDCIELEFPNLDAAKDEFARTFTEKSGNIFGSKFVKKPGRYSLVELVNGTTAEPAPNVISSTLELPVQNLVELLFRQHKLILEQDNAILEFDNAKMSLGNLGREQLKKASNVLERIRQKIENNAPEYQLKNASNEFYTLIPHNYGLENPPIINTEEILAKKFEVIESLQNIEQTQNLLKQRTGEEMSSTEFNYDYLKTKIEQLDRDSEEFKQLAKYVSNSQSKKFKLEIEGIFKITREGEAERFEPFAKINNRQLLFHGSRLTNFVNIFSNGLRVDPPDSPITGKTFGRGIYFADRVTKSANFCHANDTANTGLVLLCQVALGKMQKCRKENPNVKLHDGYKSVKGFGKIHPDRGGKYVREDGVKIPCGKQIADWTIDTELYENEFVVYDAAQVKLEYLLRMKFQFQE